MGVWQNLIGIFCLLSFLFVVTLADGLYVSNGTDILFMDSPSSTARSVLKPGGIIAGLAYDKASGFLFWSTIDILSRGIYRAKFSADGSLYNESQIIESDILEVNCLTVDWVSKHIYWADSRKKTIEISELDGSNRRILIMTGLSIPRGIYADPVNGYLFWTDQGHKHIRRSLLDGSDARVIVSGVGLPNQILVYANKLYWVDSKDKTFESADLEGGGQKTTSVNGNNLANDQHIFGLAINNNKAYITNWKNGQLITVDVDGKNPARGSQKLGTERIFSAVYVKSEHQPNGTDPCARQGCAALCLPRKGSTPRCSCPSYGGKTLNRDQRTCTSPTNILLYAMADSGYVGFYDPSAAVNNDFYVVGRSFRPVAVAYDPVTQLVYWSDVKEKTVRVSNINGTKSRIVLGSVEGIGLVEGMVVDVAGRQLYYTNIGSVSVDGEPFTWHRIETIALDAIHFKVRTLVTTADKPRGIVLDKQNGHLYYTDWGIRASIVRVNLDGSNPTLIRTGLDNPNGVTIFKNKLYFVDSHYKTRDANRGRYPYPPRNGSLYSMNLDGSGFTDVLALSSVKLQIPFGLATDLSGIYISDWDTQKLILLNGSELTSSTVFEGIPHMMAVYYSTFTVVPSGRATPCHGKTCGDICLSKSSAEAYCTCNSYGGKPTTTNGSSCSAPSSFLLVADMNSIKVVGLSGNDSNSYVAMQGLPYYSNYAGLTYNNATRTAYFSDVNRKKIYALSMDSMTTVELYSVNEVIDGLTLHENKLYWTDYSSGRISYLPLIPPSGEKLRHRTFVGGLVRPRGIRIYNGYVYWTEWGNNPTVSKKGLSGDYSKTVILSSPKVKWPNGIYICERTQRLYVADGYVKKIFNCSLDGDCQELPNMEGVMKHAYDLWMVNGVFYYSDWKTGSINAFDPARPRASWTVVGGLMRPTQFFVFQPASQSRTCPSGICSTGDCVPLLVNHACDCKNSAPALDKKSCTGSPFTCTHNGKSYLSGQDFSPDPCVQCQCLGRFPYSDPVYNDSVCQRTVCPPLNCSEGDIELRPDACCHTCSKCGIQFKNCPSEPIKMTLRNDQSFVVYEYLPSIRDCQGLARDITFVKKPRGAIYGFGSTTVEVTAVTSANQDHSLCKFNIEVKDETPPTIKCPKDEVRYITGDESSVAVQWNAPEAYDNVGLSSPPKATQSWGSSFGVGDHVMTYTATDSAGLSSSCDFRVKVVKLSGNQGDCSIPQIDNANLNCSVISGQLYCRVQCDFSSNAIEPLSCTNGKWSRPINDEFRQKTCIKEKPKTLRGSLTIKAPKSCSLAGDTKYTENFLLDSIKKYYLQDVSDNLTLTVKTTGCKTSSDDVTTVVELRGLGRNSEETNRTSNAINTNLDNIRLNLERDFLRVVLSNDDGLHTAKDLSVESKGAAAGCIPGEIDRGGSNMCEVCPAGTYQADVSCVKCQPNFYNDFEGKTDCKACPDGAKSEVGSYIIDQCTYEKNYVPVYIAVGVCLFILLVIILAVIIYKLCKNRKTPLSPGLNHPNKAYDPDFDYDCAYDKIAEPEDAGPRTSHYNDYEGLENVTAQGDNYDKLEKSEEKRKSEECCAASTNL